MAAVPEHPLLLSRFEACAEAHSDTLAIRCGGDTVSYAELNARANVLAAALLEQGVGCGAVVAVMFAPSVELVAALIAVLKSGAAYVPLDPDYPQERLQAIVEQAHPRLVLTADRFVGQAQFVDTPVLLVESVTSIGAGDQPLNPAVTVRPDDLCYLMFTSGSTGVPNGVQVTHGNIAGLFANLPDEFALSATDNWSAMHSFAFGFSLWEIWGALSTGACLTMVPRELRGDPAAWSALLVEQAVTVLSITPSAFRQWLLCDALPTAAELAALRLIVFSGEAVHGDDLHAWFERYGEAGPRLVNTYALTETAGRITTRFYQPGVAADPGNIGVPVRDAEVFVLQPGAQQALATGATGELVISGPMIARGYLNNPQLSIERFVHLDPGDGVERYCYRSGDLATLNEDGSVSFVGRADEQIKLRGYRIDLREIERLVQQHPQVRDAAVVVQNTGAAEQLVAWVVPEASNEVEFWPSLGEYQIYDDLLYDFMSADEVRVAAYQRAFARKVKDKVVLDIGTGKDAILARLCAAAGARRVYAVEVLADAYEQARQLVAELGLEEQIIVVQGDMQTIALPEKVDVCTQGIVGNIGSSDGIVPIWNDAQKFFADTYTAIPSRCETLIAPAELPVSARNNPSFSPLAAAYAERIFAAAEQIFDVRLCVRNFPLDNLLAAPAVFEDLDFQQALSDGANYQDQTEYVVAQDGMLDGFLLWTRIHTDEHEQVDFLQHQQAWLPVWLPVANEGIAVQAGDQIQVSWQCVTPGGQIFPDYSLAVRISRAGAATVSYTHTSTHFPSAGPQTELHRRLFAAQAESLNTQLTTQLGGWLKQKLPQQMQPGHWQLIDQLPLNANGKLDRHALANIELDVPQATTGYADPLEADIAAIWADVLGRDSVSRDEDFFAAGGDSILAVRLTTEVQRYLDDTVFLAALFEAPTIATYSDWLAANHAPAMLKRAGSPSVEAPIKSVPVLDSQPVAPTVLSWPQQSLWFLQQLYPDNTAANEQFLIRVAGGIDAKQLRVAWRALLARHDILRTRFAVKNGAPLQLVSLLEECIAADTTPLMDFSALDAVEAERQLGKLAAEDIQTPFDLSCAPLLRTRLCLLPADERVLLVTAHHIVADGLCVQLIRDELAAACFGQALVRPALQYADFARWQRTTTTVDAIAADLQWWAERLAGHDGQPVVGVHAQVAAAAREQRIAFTIGAELNARLRELAATEGATLFMLLLAAWRVWLQRCFAQQDVLIGSPMTMRRDQQTAGMLGCLVNNLVFRNPTGADDSFATVLRAEKEGALAAYDHATAPFEKVVEALQPERVFGRHPLFQLMFMFEDRSVPPVAKKGVSFSSDVLPVARSSYWDLELSVTDNGTGHPLSAFIGVREDLFDVTAAQGWADSFITLLEGIAAAPARSVAELPLLSRAQQQLMLHDWNATAMPVAADATLHGLVAEQMAATPAAIAVTDSLESLTYAELEVRADEYAAGLLSRGVRQGSRVGLGVTRSADTVALLLGVLRCGAAWLPLDPGYPQSRLELMRQDAAPDLVVVDGQLDWSGADCVTRAELQHLSAGQEVKDVVSKGDYPAYILFTSGSTGIPKGSVSLHAGAVSRCRWMWEQFALGTDEVFAQRTSLNFVDSIWEIFGPLMHGAQLHIVPDDLTPDAQGMAVWLAKQQITQLVVVPSLLSALLDTNEFSECTTLRTVITSGETLTAALAQRFFTRLPACRLLNTYGTSETWDATCQEVTATAIGSSSVVSLGRPVANARTYVLDARQQPLPAGVVGELCIGGLGLSTGYLNRPDLTNARFVTDPFVEDALIYRSGDLARFDSSGNLQLLGRMDRQLKLRGLRIEAGEVEQLANQFPGASQAVLLLREASEREPWLALYLVADGVLDTEQLREHLRSRLPRAMLPAEIVPLAELPLTPSGKLDVHALPELAKPTVSLIAPRNELETALADIWMAALDLPQVGIHDDFFALRGHSLLATQVIARIGEAIGIELPLASIFEAPTIAGLARSIEALRWTQQDVRGSAVTDSAAGEREVLRL